MSSFLFDANLMERSLIVNLARITVIAIVCWACHLVVLFLVQQSPALMKILQSEKTAKGEKKGIAAAHKAAQVNQ